MKFHHISLRVTDFEKSLAFYQTLTQLRVSKQFSANGGNVAYLHNAEGETEVELIAMPEGQTFEGKGMFLCFATDDLEAACRCCRCSSSCTGSRSRRPSRPSRWRA